MGLSRALRAIYRKFNGGEIMFVAGGGRRITLQGWREHLDSSQKNCISGFVQVSQIVELRKAGELRDDDVVHIAVFRADFEQKMISVKYAAVPRPHVADSWPTPEALRD